MSSPSAATSFFSLLWTALAGYGVYIVGTVAYKIRLRAIEDYGPVIHEFDPYFNYASVIGSKFKPNKQSASRFQRKRPNSRFKNMDLCL